MSPLKAKLPKPLILAPRLFSLSAAFFSRLLTLSCISLLFWARASTSPVSRSTSCCWLPPCTARAAAGGGPGAGGGGGGGGGGGRGGPRPAPPPFFFVLDFLEQQGLLLQQPLQLQDALPLLL